eukprot:2785697-Amphidinium_carterae.1
MLHQYYSTRSIITTSISCEAENWWWWGVSKKPKQDICQEHALLMQDIRKHVVADGLMMPAVLTEAS